MATLTERLDARIAVLTTERSRIEAQAVTDLASVDARLAILTGAKAAVTPDIEQAYVALIAAGLIKAVEERG